MLMQHFHRIWIPEQKNTHINPVTVFNNITYESGFALCFLCYFFRFEHLSNRKIVCFLFHYKRLLICLKKKRKENFWTLFFTGDCGCWHGLSQSMATHLDFLRAHNFLFPHFSERLSALYGTAEFLWI